MKNNLYQETSLSLYLSVFFLSLCILIIKVLDKMKDNQDALLDSWFMPLFILSLLHVLLA